MKNCLTRGIVNFPVVNKVIDLSQRIISIKDYQWLAGVIRSSGLVETIMLPDIDSESAELILTMLNNATVRNSTLISMNVNISGKNAELSAHTELMRQQIQSRLQRNQKKVFGIHGGGCIGLGLMADIVSKSPYQYQITATSNNQLIGNQVNKTGKLWLQHGGNDVTCVDGVKIISRETQDIIHLYSESCLVAISVTPAVFPCIANDIASALINRYEIDGSGLKMLILMNIPNGAEFVRKGIANELLKITGDKSLTRKILASSEFFSTVIDRIVTPIPEQQIKQQSNQNQPKIFKAEKKFTMYVPESFGEAVRFPQMTTTSDLTMIEAVKNRYINGPHAILAWMGALMGYSKVAEAIRNPGIYKFIKEMMEEEIAPILCTEYPELSQKDLTLLEDSFFERCRTIDDPVIRVGRDPMRKLDKNDRIRGTIELAKKHNLKISTHRLEKGLAAGFLYAIKFDPANRGCKKIREIYANYNDSFYSVLSYHGEAPTGSFTGFNPHKEALLINSIMSHIAQLNNLYNTVKSSAGISVAKPDARITRALTDNNRGYHP